MILFKNKKQRGALTVTSACDLTCRAEAELERIRAQMLGATWRR